MGFSNHSSSSCCSDEEYSDDDPYQELIRLMNPPKVVVDNDTSPTSTILRVESKDKHGTLLLLVQMLTEMNLDVSKAYITSEEGWFLDVFNLTDQDGKKITDAVTLSKVVESIKKALKKESRLARLKQQKSVDVASSADFTVIELAGTDHPGLLSNIGAILADLNCNIVSLEIWTYRTRVAAVMNVTDSETGLAVADPKRLAQISARLHVLLGGTSSFPQKTKAVFTMSRATHKDRRLHQLMTDDPDFYASDECCGSGPAVSVRNMDDRDYSFVTVRCKDRPKLLFDIVCILSDMNYVISHANAESQGPDAYLEFYIRCLDGSPVNSDEERQLVIRRLRAAIKLRECEGLKLKWCADDKVGLLSKVTRIFRENGLVVCQADACLRDGKAVATFCLHDHLQTGSGAAVDLKTVSTIRRELGESIRLVQQHQSEQAESTKRGTSSPLSQLLRCGWFKTLASYNFG